MIFDKEAKFREEREKAEGAERDRVAVQREKQRQEEERKKAELASMTPEQRDIHFVQNAGPKDEGKVVDIFNPMGDYVEADKHKLAEALKEYWIRCGKWQGKQSDKQKKKVQRIKEILGSG